MCSNEETYVCINTKKKVERKLYEAKAVNDDDI